MELDLLLAIQKLHTPFLDLLLTHITALGNYGIVWILAGVIFLCTKKYRKQGLLLLVSLLFCYLLGNLFLKNLVARERPCWLYPEIELLIRNPGDFSFPSGHSMTGMAGAVSVYLTNKRLGIAALILAAVIAFSRLYLFVHWPSDVLIGGLMGIAIAGIVFAAAKTLEKKSAQKKRSGSGAG